MDVEDILRWFHLIAMSTWIGGMIVVGALIPALRKAGADRTVITAAARRFGVVAWVGLGVAMATGIGQLIVIEREVAETTAFAVKMLLVGLAAALAYVHQLTASRSRPAVRGALEGILLLNGLAIVAAAIAL